VTGTAFNRGTSIQDYQTDPEFMRAVFKRFGSMDFDLAAHASNSQCGKYFYGSGSMLGTDSMAEDWSKLRGNLWLNPPYNAIALWAKKCSEYRGEGKIFFLVPASVGSNWFAWLVYPYATTYLLNGRLTFVGEKNPYPKDCLLAIYPSRSGVDPIQIWRWKS
jgi:hypothetical protein